MGVILPCILLASAAFSAPAPGDQPPPRPLRVMIDPGHDPENPGAMGASGAVELQFNDRLAEALLARLRESSALEVSSTRAPAENLGLPGRLRRASEARADVLLSLHHDSVKPQYIEYTTKDGVQLP